MTPSIGAILGKTDSNGKIRNFTISKNTLTEGRTVHDNLIFEYISLAIDDPTIQTIACVNGKMDDQKPITLGDLIADFSAEGISVQFSALPTVPKI